MSSSLPSSSVNKGELAALLGTSLPTLAAWIKRYGDDFPVSERGTNGREWRFDPAAVTAFLTARREAEERAEAERLAFLEQYRLPGLATPDEPEGVKPTDLLAMAKVRAMERREAMEAGLLVPTSDVRVALTAAFAKLNRALNAALMQIGRKHGLPDAVMRDMKAMFHEAQRGFVRDAGSFRPEEDGALFDAGETE